MILQAGTHLFKTKKLLGILEDDGKKMVATISIDFSVLEESQNLQGDG